MIAVPFTAPVVVPIAGGFDYLTVDAARGRVYAAHTAARSLTIVDASTGKVLGQVAVGPMHGVAVDPETGHVFTGNGTARSVSEVDPVTQKVVPLDERHRQRRRDRLRPYDPPHLRR